MRSFASHISTGLRLRGHTVLEMSPPVVLGNLVKNQASMAKWLGYIDQFIIFPFILACQLQKLPPATLIVFCDQALGAWIPLIRDRPHVVHCHDFLAVDASLGLIPEWKTPLLGRIFQILIRTGFRRARFFISVSNSTRTALHRHLLKAPTYSHILYNPLPSRFQAREIKEVDLASQFPGLKSGQFLFHLGKDWYKNRLGVLSIWEQLRKSGSSLDLVLVGELEPELQVWICSRPHLSPYIYIFSYLSDDQLLCLYRLASALLFPSFYEGFGWPILEALACSCTVFTTDRAPMNEVGGRFAIYLPAPPLPTDPEAWLHWSSQSASIISSQLLRSSCHHTQCNIGLKDWLSSFSLDEWLDSLERHYLSVLRLQGHD